MASNVGSTATLTGNPQNIFIGSVSHISYDAFARTLAPVAAIGIALTIVMIFAFYPEEFWTGEQLRRDPEPPRIHRKLAIKTVLVTVMILAGFFTGQPPAKVALVAGAVLLLTRAVKAEKIYHEIDGQLLLMFAGLFIVVAGFEKALLSTGIVQIVGRLHLDHVVVLSAVTAGLSNLVSNVPAVLVLKPFIVGLHDPQRTWLVVAMASTLAGNFTVLGSIANLIVVQLARARGVKVSFWEYFKIGAPLTVLTIIVGVLAL
jgi:Na+/H+ antiporter NhaD/arsenite permease-like protein